MRQILFGAGFLLAGTAWADVEFAAALSDVRADHEVCASMFAVDEYHVRHYWTGPTRRTSVMHLDALEGEDENAAFFDNSTWVGLYGGSGDLYYEKQYQHGEFVSDFLGEGFLDYNVMYLELSLDAYTQDGEFVCAGTAVLAGFN